MTLAEQLAAIEPADDAYAVRVVDLLLAAGARAGASDLHLQPTADALSVRWRIDGVLQPVAELPAGARATVIARLKVLADLLTYQTETPQEGRIRRDGAEGSGSEVRVSTFPTLFGEKAVIRLLADESRQFARLKDLGLPEDLTGSLSRLLAETSGAIMICGPAGAGKTTTAYAALREIAAADGAERSIASLEDPVEGVVAGVAQSQVNERAGFDFPRGLRSLLRQDPQVILVGEIRDRQTAEIAFQAALTGQLLLTTFHADSAAGALGRLADMGLPPFVIRSGLRAIVAQRLARRLCACAEPSNSDEARLGLAVESLRIPIGCEACGGTGYRGRLLLAEMLTPDSPDLATAILAQRDAQTLAALALAAGMIPLPRRALEAAGSGLTSPAEIRRVFGWSI